MKPTVTFMLPHPVEGPAGGYKVVYEYANRLVADGYSVHVVYSGSLFWRQKSLYFKLTNCVRYLQHLWRGYSCRRWFALDRRVKEHLSLSLNKRHLPKSDVYICTSPHTAVYLNTYRGCKRLYLIQDYENWGNIGDERLRATYHFPLTKIVISRWLKRLIEQEEHEQCHLIPNGFDFDYFRLTTPIEQKQRYRITMLYHQMQRKGCDCGFAALAMVKQRYPQLRVNLFGTPQRPDNLPEWYDYYQMPDRNTHNRIYNEAALFLGTSEVEGWGLTVGEAMMCGCAVVCTDNDGYREMATDGTTALVSPVKDAEALAANIVRLLDDDTLRCRLAAAGNEFIQRFQWSESYSKLRRLIDEKDTL